MRRHPEGPDRPTDRLAWRDRHSILRPLRRLGLAVAGVVVAAPLYAQRPRELGLEAITTFADPALVAGAGYAAARFGERTRGALALGIGASDGDVAGRGELALHFLLSPRKALGVGVYAGGGVAGVIGPRDEGYALLVLGIEERPGGRHGWMAEVGVGGGVRVAAGYRWRTPGR
ncbi:MAG: hypothetical protein ACOY71_10035 [Gemmatimonadota bacterium]